MGGSRRRFLGGAAAASIGAATVGVPERAQANNAVSADRIGRLFAKLPGTVAYKILAPATKHTRRLELSSNAGRRLFVGSAFNTFVAAEALRQADSPDVVGTITERQLALDASVWSLDSATFNPPNLSAPSRSARRSKR
jgi:beta-lactamase class A